MRVSDSVANSEDVPWLLWSALLFVLAIATVVYRRDVTAARAQALSGSRILETLLPGQDDDRR
jgi:hypothetical protein